MTDANAVALCEAVTDTDTLRAHFSIVCHALDIVSSGMLVTDMGGRIIYANSEALTLFECGQEQVVGRKVGDFFASRAVEGLVEFWEATGQTQESTDEFVVRREDGAELVLEVSIHPIGDDSENLAGRVVVFVDVTAERKAQERLAQYEHLAMLGQLTGGTAHELRNSLGLIKGAAHFLNVSLVDPGPEVAKAVSILKSGVEKSDQIVRSLLTVARPTPSSRREVDVNKIVRDALAGARIPENVESVTQLDASLPEIMADAGQLNVILDNLIRNAIQAMPDGGRLKVSTEMCDGEWIVASVADTGKGISEADQKKLFEPLFTKRSGGTGLGLALVRSLTEGHGGHVELESELGEGSVFSVHLPIDKEPLYSR